MKKLVECGYSLFTSVKRKFVHCQRSLCDIALELGQSTNPQLKVLTLKRPTSFQMQHHH